MNWREEYHIRKQLEPEERLAPTRFNWPRNRAVVEFIPLTQEQKDWLAYKALSEEEQNRLDDEQLARMGVPINPKQRI